MCSSVLPRLQWSGNICTYTTRKSIAYTHFTFDHVIILFTFLWKKTLFMHQWSLQLTIHKKTRFSHIIHQFLLIFIFVTNSIFIYFSLTSVIFEHYLRVTMIILFIFSLPYLNNTFLYQRLLSYIDCIFVLRNGQENQQIILILWKIPA